MYVVLRVFKYLMKENPCPDACFLLLTGKMSMKESQYCVTSGFQTRVRPSHNLWSYRMLSSPKSASPVSEHCLSLQSGHI